MPFTEVFLNNGMYREVAMLDTIAGFLLVMWISSHIPPALGLLLLVFSYPRATLYILIAVILLFKCAT